MSEEYRRVTKPGYRADFRLVPFWAAILVGGIGSTIALTGVLAHYPDVVPYGSLGPAGSFLRAMAYDYHFLCLSIFWGEVLIHIGEGMYQWILCRRHNFTPLSTLLWVAQTTMFGFPSLIRFKKCLKKAN